MEPIKKEKSKLTAKQELIRKFLEEQENLWAEALEDPESFRELVRVEETLVRGIYASSDTLVQKMSPPIQDFLEEIDQETAELRMSATPLDPVPDYLLRYRDMNLDKPERKASLVVRLSQAGIQVFESLIEGLQVHSNLATSPGLRSAAAAPATSNDAGFVVFEETVQKGQKFFYQMVRETPEEVFLSIKIDSDRPEEDYRQVILRKDGRFILSNKINSEGIVNFGGLKEGAYSVEFLGRNTNKFVDLYLIVE